MRSPLYKALLGLSVVLSAPSRADDYFTFVKVSCIPEARYLQFESKTIQDSYVVLGVDQDQLRDERLAVWRKNGYHDRLDLPFECNLPESTYSIKLEVVTNEVFGICGPQSPQTLTLLRNGETILDHVAFGAQCPGLPAILSVEISDGLQGWDTRQMTICLSPTKGAYVFLSDTYQGITEAVPIDQATIARYVTEKKPSEIFYCP